MTSTSEILEAYRRAFGREAHLLTRTPGATFQQLHNRLQWEGDAVERRLGPQRTRWSVRDARPWFRLHTRLPESTALVRTINAVGALAFAQDSGALVTVGSGGAATFWDVGTGAAIRTLQLSSPTGGNPVHRCDVSPDGSFVVASGSAGTIRSWDLWSGAERLVIRGPRSGATDRAGRGSLPPATIMPGWPLAVSPDGTHIVGGDEAGSLTVWDSLSGNLLRTARVHEGPLTACAVSPDGSFIVSGGSDGAVRLWDLATGSRTDLEALRGLERAPVERAGGHSGTTASRAAASIATASEEVGFEEAHLVWSTAVSPDASFVVAMSGERIGVWDRPGGRLRWNRQYYQPTGGSPFQARGCAISPDGALIVMFGEGRLLRLLDPGTGEIVSTLVGHSDPVRACAISPDGALIASAGDDGIRVWDARVRGEWESLEGHGDRITSCAFDPAGTRAVTTSADEKLVVWSAHSCTAEVVLEGHLDAVQDCAFVPDGTQLVSAGRDHTARLWDLEAAAEIRRWESDDPVRGCAVSPDGTELLLGSGGSASFWELETGRCLLTRPGRGDVWRCAYSPDGSWAVTSGAALTIWDLPSGGERATLAGHRGLVGVCAVSPDGTFIASGGEDATVRLWDPSSHRELRVLTGHEASVWGCAVSPDGRHVLSASWDRTVRCWNVASGLEEARLSLPARAHGAAFHPASLRAVCGDDTGWVHFVELMGVELGPIVVTARDEGETVSFRCPACQRETQIGRRALGSRARCPACEVELQLNAGALHVRGKGREATGHRSAEVEVGTDEGLERMTKTCTACHYRFALLLYACPRCGSAVAEPPSPEAEAFMQMRQQSAMRHVDRGSQLFQQGRHDEAEAEFRRAVSANPWNATAHGNLGVVMRRRGRLEEAVHWLERAVEIDPRVAGGRELLARARAELARR